MDRFHQINPFVKRDSHSPNSIIAYKVLTLLSWVLSVVVSVYYTFEKAPGAYGSKIWWQNFRFHTGFALEQLLTSVYWIVLFILQLGYIGHLFSTNIEYVNSACAVGSHFILNNLLHFAFVMLFVRSQFIWAEVILVLNFFNLSSQYFRHNKHPRFIHLPAVSGPLAWTFVALFWNGAMMVPHPDSFVARIFANIFIWAILGYGLFFIVIYKDYTMGFCLTVLSLSLALHQSNERFIALQWIFAFTIMSVLFVATVIVALPFRSSEGTAGERAPLIQPESDV